MGRDPRHIPPGCSLVAVTIRTVQSRYLLRPSRDLTDTIHGILGRATTLYDVDICYYIYLSNHAHLLLRPADVDQLALFMCYVNGNIAREAGRLHNWREKFWGRRYNHSINSNEESVQIAALRYHLAQGCKESLVRKPEDWPGATGVHALLTGRPILGVWFDRTRAYEAERRGEKPGKYGCINEQTFSLVPLPAWEHLPPAHQRQRARALVREIEQETRRMMENDGKAPVGAKRLQRQNPHGKPDRSKKTPAPRFHAASREARLALEASFRDFFIAFRQAADSLRAGAKDADFPPGSFPPRLAFVPNRPRPPTSPAVA